MNAKDPVPQFNEEKAATLRRTPDLRRRAEERLRAGKAEAAAPKKEDTLRLVHELQVHQIELEMQNEELHRSRAEVEAGLERFTELYDFAPVGYLTLGRGGVVRHANLTGSRLLGVERARLQGRRFGVFVCESDRAGFLAFLEKAFASQATEVCEVMLRKEAEGLLNVQLTATAAPDGQGCRVVIADITARKQAEEALRESQTRLLKANEELEQKVKERTADLAARVDELRNANEQLDDRASALKALTKKLIIAEQAERKRLSHVIHDGLQQHLLAAKIRLGGVAGQVGSIDLKLAVDEIEQIMGESVKMSRSLSAELSPPILHEGDLVDGLEWLGRWMREKNHFDVDLAIETRPMMDGDAKVLVFESVRELLFNVIKHARVSKARVSIEEADAGRVRIAVSDEGCGFDPCQLKLAGEEGGFGLFSIRERISLISGVFEIESAFGKGSRFTLGVPVLQKPTVPFSANCSASLVDNGKEKEN
jgi:PAS domain S-box-containing protein